jgi:hypothetical protein
MAVGQEAYLKLDALGWPNGGDNYADNFYVRLMPPQIARSNCRPVEQFHQRWHQALLERHPGLEQRLRSSTN